MGRPLFGAVSANPASFLVWFAKRRNTNLDILALWVLDCKVVPEFACTGAAWTVYIRLTGVGGGVSCAVIEMDLWVANQKER